MLSARLPGFGGHCVIPPSILPAMGLFFLTTIDDTIVLALFFARGTGQ